MLIASLCIVVAINALPALSSDAYEQYIEQRDMIMHLEENLSINAAWDLTAEETIADELLQQMKAADNALDPVPVQFNFVTMQPQMDKSPLFVLLKSLPKGSLLHSHDVSSLDMHFYVMASYMPGCLYNTDTSSAEYGCLTFKPKPNYVPIADVRKNW